MEMQPSLLAPNIAFVRTTEKSPGTHCRGPLAMLLFLFLALFFQSPAFASESTQKTAQTALHILDYLSIDYGGAVFLEKVINQAEYEEQLSFSKQSIALLSELPDHPRKLNLVAKARSLFDLIQEKASSSFVHRAAQELRQEIIQAYQVSIAPNIIPQLDLAAVLFSQACAVCHGVEGYGDGPGGKTLSPRPADFHDNARMSQRNVYALYNAITLGVSGTAMDSYPEFSDEERWSLAFYLSNLRISDESIKRGQRNWENSSFHGPSPNLAALSSLTSNEISIRYGEQANTVYDFLRSKPAALSGIKHSSLLFAIEQLNQTANLYQSGKQSQALRASIDAYLEGFDPVEISLDSHNQNLRLQIEREMRGIRSSISEHQPVEIITQKINTTKILLRQADELLRDGKMSSTDAFSSSFFVLLLEGATGMLLIAAIIIFMVRVGESQSLIYVHTGWISAMLLCIPTWLFSSWLLTISGAQREIINGILDIFSAVILVYVGFWLRDKTQTRSWDTSISMALKGKYLWVLSLLSFFAIYREVIDSVLSYQTIWIQTNDIIKPAILIGVFAASLILISIGWMLLKICVKLPLNLFISATMIFLGFMAVIFSGEGVIALQDADALTRNPIGSAAFPILGFYPTVQSLLTQFFVICIMALYYLLPFRRQSDAVLVPEKKEKT